MSKYYYKTIEGRKRNDTARNEHISKINELKAIIYETQMCSDTWVEFMKRLNKLETQLYIYDREMGY